MPKPAKNNGNKEKRVTRYTYDEVKEPRTPETGHTALLPADEQVVTVPLDNGWSKALKTARPLETDERPVVVDLDPAADPTLLWAGKRNRRHVPILPLQRNEVVTDSRIGQIVARARKAAEEKAPQMGFNSIFAELEKQLREADKARRVEFYVHEEGWKNKLICGDSLHVIESLLHYEGLRGKVQMVYIDPPYGIRYDSNFQQRIDSTRNDDKDQADEVLTIKAFRDTWALGVHSYLSYLQERLYLCRDLLSESGSVFVQMGEDNLHLVRALMAEVFGTHNYVTTVAFRKTGSSPTELLGSRYDYLLWFAKDREQVKFRRLYTAKQLGDVSSYRYKESPDGELKPVTDEEKAGTKPLPQGWKLVQLSNLATEGAGSPERDAYEVKGKVYRAGEGKHWKTSHEGLNRLLQIRRIVPLGSQLNYKRYFDDFPWLEIDATWDDTGSAGFSSSDPKVYVVQTDTKVISRCIQMTTSPGDLVLDITSGSGTTAYASEQLGRRWIACDTSRVAVNVARRRLLSSTFDHFKTRNGKISSGFICRTVPRITLKSLAYDQEPERVELVDQPEIDRFFRKSRGKSHWAGAGRSRRGRDALEVLWARHPDGCPTGPRRKGPHLLGAVG